MEAFIESDVKEFVKRLPALSDETVHLIMLAVRSRKATKLLGFKIKDLVIERKVIRQMINKENTVSEWGWWRNKYLDTVYNYAELQLLGRYHIREILAPSRAMAIYGTISPRNVKSAVITQMKENLELLGINDVKTLAKQHSMFFGKLHATKAKGYAFQTIDIDTMEPEVYRRIRDFISVFPIWMITKTARGYHIILDLAKSNDARTFYAPGFGGAPSYAKLLMDNYEHFGVELQRDSQEPIPGTLYYKDESMNPNYVEIME